MHSDTEHSQTQRRLRRHFSLAFKADLVAQCRLSNASVAAIAQAHNIDASMLKRWVREQALRDQQQAELAAAGTPIAVPTTAPTTAVTAAQAPASTARFIEITPLTSEQARQPLLSTRVAGAPPILIELPFRQSSIRLDWPIEHADGLAACLRQLLQ